MNTKKFLSVTALLAVGTVFGVAIANTKAGSKIKSGIDWGKDKLGLREETKEEREERSERSESSSASGREDRR
jgi:hypothetical protein